MSVIIRGDFVIEHNGLFKRSAERGGKGKWNSLTLANSYGTLARANLALKLTGKGTLMHRLPGEAATYAHFNAYGLTAPQGV